MGRDNRLQALPDCLIDHYPVLCLFSVMLVPTLLGMGDMPIVSLLGLPLRGVVWVSLAKKRLIIA